MLRERPSYRSQEIPADADRQKILLRSLMNIRQPWAVSRSFLEVQDAYLQEELVAKRITRLSDLHPVQEGIYLWRGDITTLKCRAIVNAANSGMTGCYQPCHSGIDNCIQFPGCRFVLCFASESAQKAIKGRWPRYKGQRFFLCSLLTPMMNVQE